MLAILCLLASAQTPALGIDRSHPAIDLVADLESTRAGDRLLAARELRRVVAAGTRRAARANDPLEAREAEIAVHDACADTAAARHRAVGTFRDVRKALAEVAVGCEDTAALPSLRDARAAETRAGVIRKLDAAIAALEAG